VFEPAITACVCINSSDIPEAFKFYFAGDGIPQGLGEMEGAGRRQMSFNINNLVI
jgi:hypothetical protein